MTPYNQTFPMHAGYALGNIITESNLFLPYYEKKCARLDDELNRLEAEKEAEKIKIGQNDQQKVINKYSVMILKHRKEIDDLQKHIQRLKEQSQLNGSDDLPVEESLPFDRQKIVISNENLSFYSERMSHLTFKTKDNLYFQVKDFVSKLFLYEASSSMLPFGTLDSMVKTVENMLGEHQTQVNLVGSFITLEKVRKFEPLILRKGHKVSEHLLNNHKIYFVLTEAVLGGVFLGLGKVLETDTKPNSTTMEVFRNTFSTLSYFCQGAIPKKNNPSDDHNLLSLYSQWKDSLIENSHSGYPIGFKVRRLTDVLRENGYQLK